jgi:hypothetical protein
LVTIRAQCVEAVAAPPSSDGADAHADRRTSPARPAAAPRRRGRAERDAMRTGTTARTDTTDDLLDGERTLLCR